jgi:glycosyltransferase involved in cell wall biosynthesis
MRFLILTHVVHKKEGNDFYAYGPYIREMNIWLKYFDKIIIVAPINVELRLEKNDLAYNHPNIIFIQIPQFDLQGIRQIIRTVFILPLMVYLIFKGMHRADHIHIRCPGNVGLLGCFIQLFYPGKKKTAKYAGNWDWESKQPWSYRLQQKLLRNTFLTRNMTTLVYGDWPDKTKNIKPFFTASYSKNEIPAITKNVLDKEIRLAYIGSLVDYKSPLTSLEVLKVLTDNGISSKLIYCGDGPEREKILQKAREWNLEEKVELPGNVDSEKVKKVLRETHFLVFISKSEGWPKAVAEAMWWGCIPVTTPVSCVPQMLGNGERGFLVDNDPEKIASIIQNSLHDPEKLEAIRQRAMEWARQYTLERFEEEIKLLIQ